MVKEPPSAASVWRFSDGRMSEEGWWRERQSKFASDEFRQQKRKSALAILRDLKASINNGILDRLLEVGGGGDPMVEYFDGNIGVVIDPLARLYKTELFSDPLASVEYFCGVGESLPFKSDFFDGVLLYNCIDHGSFPFNILNESRRVLREGVAIHVLVDTYSFEFRLYRRLMERVFLKRRDEKHPHTLSFDGVTRYLGKLGFVEMRSYHDEHPCSRVLNTPKKSISMFLKDIWRGHRALRAFYRLDKKEEIDS